MFLSPTVSMGSHDISVNFPDRTLPRAKSKKPLSLGGVPITSAPPFPSLLIVTLAIVSTSAFRCIVPITYSVASHSEPFMLTSVTRVVVYNLPTNGCFLPQFRTAEGARFYFRRLFPQNSLSPLHSTIHLALGKISFSIALSSSLYPLHICTVLATTSNSQR